MTHTRKNRDVCSSTTTVQLENGVIRRLQVNDGCDGNLKGVCTLAAGRPAEEIIPLLEGIRCDNKKTSCPAQIAACLREALALEAGQQTPGAANAG